VQPRTAGTGAGAATTAGAGAGAATTTGAGAGAGAAAPRLAPEQRQALVHSHHSRCWGRRRPTTRRRCRCRKRLHHGWRGSRGRRWCSHHSRCCYDHGRRCRCRSASYPRAGAGAEAGAGCSHHSRRRGRRCYDNGRRCRWCRSGVPRLAPEQGQALVQPPQAGAGAGAPLRQRAQVPVPERLPRLAPEQGQALVQPPQQVPARGQDPVPPQRAGARGWSGDRLTACLSAGPLQPWWTPRQSRARHYHPAPCARAALGPRGTGAPFAGMRGPAQTACCLPKTRLTQHRAHCQRQDICLQHPRFVSS